MVASVALVLLFWAASSSLTYKRSRPVGFASDALNGTSRKNQDAFTSFYIGDCIQHGSGHSVSIDEDCLATAITSFCAEQPEDKKDECQNSLETSTSACSKLTDDEEKEYCYYDCTWMSPTAFYRLYCWQYELVKDSGLSSLEQYIKLYFTPCACVNKAESYDAALKCGVTKYPQDEVDGCIVIPSYIDASDSTTTVYTREVCNRQPSTISGQTFRYPESGGVSSDDARLIVEKCQFKDFTEDALRAKHDYSGYTGFLAVTECNFTNCLSRRALSVSQQQAVIQHCNFTQCGWAIDLDVETESSISNCRFIQCTVTDRSSSYDLPGLITIETTAKVTITRCIFNQTVASASPACISVLLTVPHPEHTRKNADQPGTLVLSHLAFSDTQVSTSTAGAGLEASVEADDDYDGDVNKLVTVSDVYTTGEADTALTLGGSAPTEGVASASATEIEDKSGAKEDANIPLPSSSPAPGDDDGFPAWAIVVIIVGAVAIIAVVVCVVVVMKRRSASHKVGGESEKVVEVQLEQAEGASQQAEE